MPYIDPPIPTGESKVAVVPTIVTPPPSLYDAPFTTTSVGADANVKTVFESSTSPVAVRIENDPPEAFIVKSFLPYAVE